MPMSQFFRSSGNIRNTSDFNIIDILMKSKKKGKFFRAKISNLKRNLRPAVSLAVRGKSFFVGRHTVYRLEFPVEAADAAESGIQRDFRNGPVRIITQHADGVETAQHIHIFRVVNAAALVKDPAQIDMVDAQSVGNRGEGGIVVAEIRADIFESLCKHGFAAGIRRFLEIALAQKLVTQRIEYGFDLHAAVFFAQGAGNGKIFIAHFQSPWG